MLKKWFKNYLGESHFKHKYIFIKMQDNEDFKKRYIRCSLYLPV
ncbi:Hypothetical protein NF53_2139 [Bacillus thuringiensis serovar indiana]|nr:Hypothetical protein NF53_2139 [Bacillus thuringiensis serovar indiana]